MNEGLEVESDAGAAAISKITDSEIPKGTAVNILFKVPQEQIADIELCLHITSSI